MANALASATSPYLRQHASNPVDWQPWSPQALERAAREGKPLLISIGYAACHWCHVMARESFEDPAVADVMNEHFVCIKVDREERPDVDAIYLEACQLMTGHGGWPLHAFATPDGRPFWAGTYFPPQPSRGLPAFTQVLLAVAEAWRDRREELEQQGTELAADLGGAANLRPQQLPPASLIDDAIATLARSFDAADGGFGGAPKFPPHTALALLLRRRELPMARYTLHAMAGGGICDQLAGGFSRYAVDAAWTVPHFEKMLYDNALLGARYAEAAHATGDASFGRVAERTLDWMLRELGDEDGGLASALDADAGGLEGSSYVWTPAQLRDALGDEDAAVAARWFGVTDAGNFEQGASVLEARGPAPDGVTAERIVTALLAARDARPQPARDDKRVVSWNALAIQGLVASALHLGRADHLDAAVRCAELIERAATLPDGRVRRLVPGPADDPAAVPGGVLDDHAHLLEAYVALHEATFDPRWFEAASRLAEVLLRDFADPEHGGFFATAAGDAPLIARRKELEDSPLPSGQASAALGLLRLHALSGDARWLHAAEGVLCLGAELAARHPRAFAHWLVALDQYHQPPVEIAIIGEGAAADALVETARREAPAHAVISGASTETGTPPVLAGRTRVSNQPTAYVCEGMACRRPVTHPEDLRAELHP